METSKDLKRKAEELSSKISSAADDLRNENKTLKSLHDQVEKLEREHKEAASKVTAQEQKIRKLENIQEQQMSERTKLERSIKELEREERVKE